MKLSDSARSLKSFFVTVECATKFKAMLELAVDECPYFDGFGVACNVLHLQTSVRVTVKMVER